MKPALDMERATPDCFATAQVHRHLRIANASQQPAAGAAPVVAGGCPIRDSNALNTGEMVEQSLAELQRQFDRHAGLLRSVVRGRCALLEAECASEDCEHRRKLRAVVLEVIEVLEQTRKAFKSKRLENLKHELFRILLDDAKVA